MRKTAIITGSNGHLGQEITKRFLEENYNLICIDIQEKSSLNDARINYHKCNLEKSSEITVLLKEIGDQRVDVLINNAAFVGAANHSGWNTEFENQSIDTFNRCLLVNLTSVFQLCQGLKNNLARTKNGGSIINISSIYGSLKHKKSLYKNLNMTVPAAYAASKGGLNQLTKWLAVEMAPNVRVNAIAPGGIERSQSEIFKSRYEQEVLLGRMAEEKDISEMILFLANNNKSSYITGEIFQISGGIYL